MFKNIKDITIIILVVGLMGLLVLIVAGDFYIALAEERPVDESVINLLKMSITGILGILAGFILTVLGIIFAIHAETHNTLGILISFAGVMSMLTFLPHYKDHQ